MKKKQAKHTDLKLHTSTVSTVISLSLVLFMLGVLGVVIINTQRLSNYIKENIRVTIMLKDNIKEIDILQFQKKLDASEWVKTSQYVSQEDAAADLQKDLGEDFIQFLGFNPLSSSLDIHLHAKHANTYQLSKLEKNLKQHILVQDVVFQKDLVSAINQNLKKVSIILISFSSLLLIIAIALINNTIRLSVYSKRFLIRTMKLVGASNGFIKKPFIYNSIIQGLFGSLIGILLILIALSAIQKEVPELLMLQDLPSLVMLLGCMIIFGILMSLITTNIAIRKYLYITEDKLY